MKKTVAIAFALLLAFSLAACGGGNTPSGTSSTVATSQEADTIQSSTPGESVNNASDDKVDDDAIAVKDATCGYNGGSEQAFVQIHFGRASFADVELAEIRDVDAGEAGFSTTGNFTLLTVSVFGNGLTITFDGTAENYGDIPDIAYTMPAEPVLTDSDGTPVESFSITLPYHDLSLYE